MIDMNFLENENIVILYILNPLEAFIITWNEQRFKKLLILT